VAHLEWAAHVAEMRTVGEYRILMLSTSEIFENKVLGKILGPERDEACGKFRILHNKELGDKECI